MGPLDEDHLEHLYGRLESYSVDMMLHKLDRVNKLGAEILSMEETLLDIRKSEMRSNNVSRGSTPNSRIPSRRSKASLSNRELRSKDSLSKEASARQARPGVGSANAASRMSNNPDHQRPHSYEGPHSWDGPQRSQRPHSYEGIRSGSIVPPEDKNKDGKDEDMILQIEKKTAW